MFFLDLSQQLKYHTFSTHFFLIFSQDYSEKNIPCTYFAMEVVEHQMMVGVGVVVRVLQGPEEDMIQAHLEGEGVVGHQGEGDLWRNIIEIKPSI